MEKRLREDLDIGAHQKVITHPEVGIETFERKLSSTMTPDGVVWAAVGREKSGIGDILFLTNEKSNSTMKRISFKQYAPVSGQPSIYSGNGSELSTVWVEKDANTWRISHINANHLDKDQKPTYIFESENLCMQPTITRDDSSTWAAWSTWDPTDSQLKIMVSNNKDDGSWASPIVFAGGENSFRPVIASNGKEIFISWDSIDGKEYKIEYRIINQNKEVLKEGRIGREDERWLTPAVTTGNDGSFYMSFIIVKDVIDKSLGIIDHQVAAGFAVIKNGELKYLPDTKIDDSVIAADLREGLLAKVTYYGYHGLRRNMHPVVTHTGEIWLAWEVMFEPGFEKDEELSKYKLKSNAVCGSLIGKKLNGSNWGDTLIIHNGGSNYTVPSKIYSDNIPVIYFDQVTDNLNPEFKLLFSNPDNAIRLNRPVKNRWDRWSKLDSCDIEYERYHTKGDNEELKLFWADTHVHSVYSPDAEGEPDELISFAKNISGIDVMAMVDNDFYPYFSLTGLKWSIHQELARIFTQVGKFVVFPGYEYTYHDEKLINGMNHRYVLYPGTDGKAFRRIDQGSDTIEGLMEKIKDTDALAFAHHTAWKLTGHPYDSNVEICSSWRVCKEESDFVDMRLKEGERFSFIGSSDTHRASPGFGGALTGIYAENLTPESIFEAYRKHRTIATQGQRIVIDFRVDDLFIGDEGDIKDDPYLTLNVKSEEPLEFVEIIRDGEAIKHYECKGTSLVEAYKDEGLSKGEHYYYVRVKTQGEPSFNAPEGITDTTKVFFIEGSKYPHNLARAKGPFAWCTPIWVVKL
ncbi:MAG: hypothetical protein GX783_12525 [Clostridiales bacterium]|nr:hypothetical protein [Clostridiales bacterium]